MSDKQEYRIRRYNYRSWCIQERHIVERTDAKNYGQWTEWVDYKYPGRLEHAISAMVQLTMVDENQVFYDQASIVTALADAVTTLKAYLLSDCANFDVVTG